jgi:hypothetical protein
MARAKSGYKGVSRIDQPKKNTHGWYVRVSYNGQLHSKFFSDFKYDGKEKSLQEAISYRNKLETELGKPRTDRVVVVKHPRNKTGMLGVQRTVRKQKKGNKVYYWSVYVITYQPEPGVVKSTSVSINKYGEKEAFLRACAIRKQKEREIYGSEIGAKDLQESEVEVEIKSELQAKEE